MRRPALQSGEEQPDDDDDTKRAEPDHHSVDLTFELFEPLFQLTQISLGGDVIAGALSARPQNESRALNGLPLRSVIPTKAGTQGPKAAALALDPRLRGGDNDSL